MGSCLWLVPELRRPAQKKFRETCGDLVQAIHPAMSQGNFAVTKFHRTCDSPPQTLEFTQPQRRDQAKTLGERSISVLLNSQQLAIMATNGDFSDEELSHSEDENDTHDHDFIHEEVEQTNTIPKSALKKGTTAVVPVAEIVRPPLPEQPDPLTLDVATLTPLTPEIIARQATINIGTIGHVAHGKSTVVKAISGVQTVR